MNDAIPTRDRVRIKKVEVLSDNWYVLRKTTFDYQRRDGVWQSQSRETYDRGNGATILLYNRAKRTVILTRQFRFPAFVNKHDGMLIETCAGLLDSDEPLACIQRETEEETGYRIEHVRKVFEAFMSPGSVTERLYFFVGEYFDKDRVGNGGGVKSDGEDIEVLELSLNRALAMIDSGEIADGKTIMLLQYAQLYQLID
ncbi:GDP-mannose pyrophosphatase NudK [Mycetohabitans sp. B5]|uniref:GDP-mannose pyrophosphatase n=1 Tax=Mycetohabitans endofungorum TaxID=417203 RepID=A0A2P5K6U7_9BURK|nr:MULTISPECIES: GDP-mannose pyrophosphatase NudK [Mycetohabitans]MCG1056014.1 GDP-mannose pyrophosphatase NudK [Mycetohabitans sp. B5]PPB81387.1 nudix-type nucleoside diphosphatase (YffH/AdpP family) [Mycetohabitans endofungorum]